MPQTNADNNIVKDENQPETPITSEVTNASPKNLASELPPEQAENEVMQPVPPFLEVAGLVESMQLLTTEFQSLQRGFDSKIKYDKSKDEVINALHKELQSYRDGLHLKILRPVFTDLIAMYDDFNTLLAHTDHENLKTETEKAMLKNLISFQGSIEDILYRYGITMYSEEGDQYNAQRQRSIKTVSTESAEQNRLVAKKLRKGFEYEGRILRPELVAIFKYNQKGDN